MKNGKRKSVAPAICLIFFAPLIAEVLPGATRFSSMFVFPIEVSVWGGGALLIRHVVRKRKLGRANMLFLALALSFAEEFLIQQTSIAPMVIKIKGAIYARAFGINYVYLLWAVIYESVLVVFIPVYLAELIFPNRKNDLWIGKGGVILFIILFLLGSYLAWFSWTRIARINVFHLGAYTPPLTLVMIGITLVVILIFLGIKFSTGNSVQNLNVPKPWIVAITGGLWAIILYGISALAFGVSPTFPPGIAIVVALLLAAAAIYFVPRWKNNINWSQRHSFFLIFGVMAGSMLVGFVGFIGAAPIDLYFKIIVNVIAFILLIVFGERIKNINQSD
jgi:hypothetical protein